jgi:LysM repeat protein
MTALCFAYVLGASSAGWAQNNAYVHIVRPGDTLASISQQYYGDAHRERVIVVENGLTAQGGASIVAGLRLIIPTVNYHSVTANETWNDIAVRFYGDSRRAFAISEANPTLGSQPDPGAEVVIPYPVRHIAGQHETLSKISQRYYGTSDNTKTLQRFNKLRSSRLQRGQLVLVPLSDLKLSPDGQRLMAEKTGRKEPEGSLRDTQLAAEEQLPRLNVHNRRGQYVDTVSLGNRLLAAGPLSSRQRAAVMQELAVAYVALRRYDLAEEAFRSMLGIQPSYRPDPIRTSPLVIQAFKRAMQAPPKQAAAPSDASVNSKAAN